MHTEAEWTWAGGAAMLSFNPVAEGSADLPPSIESITAVLPDGTRVSPVRVESVNTTAPGGVSFRFDPELPAGSVVRVDGKLLYTVEDHS